MRSCPSCSAELTLHAAYCANCGEPTPTAKAEAPTSTDSGRHARLKGEFGERLQQALGGRYQLQGLIGQGGFGAVYAAWDGNLERRVAVKSIRPGLLAWPDFVERFRREAKLLAQLRHANVVEIFDFGESDGVAYMVMPFLGGTTLEHKLQAVAGLDAADALPIMHQVAEGLLAVHDRGIVHRDVKPANIMWDEATAHWRIMDFGIAKAEAPGLLSLTSTSTAIGTPHYMAPEQAEDPRGTDHRADIYSYGATFYRTLTGRPPFEGDTPLAVLIKAKIDPLVSPRSLNPGIPGYLNDCVERCLAKEPADRLQSFREVLTVLDTGESGGPSAWDLPSDPISNEAMGRYQRHRGVYLAEDGAVLREPDVYELPTGRRLVIAWGDITDHDVDAIVSSDDNLLSMGGGVSGRILIAGGASIAEEAKRFVPVHPGRVIITRAGSLKASFVFHAVTLGFEPKNWGTHMHWGATVEPSRDLISEIIDGCFYHAETLELQSLAFPLLGTGAGGFARDLCLDTMFRVLLRKLLFGVTSVREARIVIFRV